MADPRPAWFNPEAPPDPEPPHWRERTVAECGITGKPAAALIGAKLTKLGIIHDTFEAGDFPKLPGVGAGTVAKLHAAVAAWRDGE